MCNVDFMFFLLITSFCLGVALSLDDFYLISSGLAATETTLFVYDKELYKNLSSFESVYEPIRVMVSHRLAKNGSDWANIFKQHNRYLSMKYDYAC